MIIGGAATTVYVVGAVTAYAWYPGDFSPWNNNWLSDLGNRALNPSGAWAYRLGCFLSGLLMGVLYVSLTTWHRTRSRRQRWLVGWSQLLGTTAAVALVMTVVYPEDLFEAHQLWSRILFAAFAGLLFVSAFAFRSRGQANVPIVITAALGYLVITASLVLPDMHWLEWAAVADVLIFTCLLGARTTALCRETRRSLPTPA